MGFGLFMTRLLSTFQDLLLDIKTGIQWITRPYGLSTGYLMAGTERDKTLRRSRGHIFPILRAKETLHMCKRLRGAKYGRECQNTVSLDIPPTICLCDEIHLD